MAAKMLHAVLIDGRNLFDPETARRAGFDYSGIGRAARLSETAPIAEPALSRAH
jgi:hypothetical protein